MPASVGVTAAAARLFEPEERGLISCAVATHTTHLAYSAIKFLRFEDFIWSGNSLPLRLEPIGELFSVQVRLGTLAGSALAGAYWERGSLHHPFVAQTRYVLEMRLEYRLPLTVQSFKSDFQSIHPRDYRVALDFATAFLPEGAGRAMVVLGAETEVFDLATPFTRELAGGQRVELHLGQESASLMVSAHGDGPYCHRAFPELRLGGR